MVLFVCTTTPAAAWLPRPPGHHAAGRVEVRSAGSEPGDPLNPAVVAVLCRAWASIPSREFPKPLTDEVGAGGRRHRHHGLRRHVPGLSRAALPRLGPGRSGGPPVEEVRPIVDEIDRRVRALLDELVPPLASTGPAAPSLRRGGGRRSGQVVEGDPVDGLGGEVRPDPRSRSARRHWPSRSRRRRRTPEAGAGDVVVDIAVGATNRWNSASVGAGSVPLNPPMDITGSPVASW